MLTEIQKIATYKMLGLITLCSGGSEHKMNWAMNLLENNIETENLAILATLLKPINEFEVDEYFNRVLRELNTLMPSKPQAIEGYAKVLAKEVIEGSITPESGASKIYEANVQLGYVQQLSEFVDLDDEWYCEHIYGWSKEQRKEEIIRASKAAFESLNYPEIFQA
jgi:archaellin